MLLPNILGNDLFDAFDNFFYPAFEVPARNVEKKLYGGHAGRIMKTDVREHETGYEILVDLPGFKKEEIQLSLEGGYLTVSAEKGIEKEEEKKGKLIRQERYAGSLQRSFYVGEAVEETDIGAKFENGVLSLQIPKKAEKKLPEKKTIMIEG